jgi:hypothetical protein
VTRVPAAELRAIARRLSGQGLTRPHLAVIGRIRAHADRLTAGERWQLEAFSHLKTLSPSQYDRLRQIEGKVERLRQRAGND